MEDEKLRGEGVTVQQAKRYVKIGVRLHRRAGRGHNHDRDARTRLACDILFGLGRLAAEFVWARRPLDRLKKKACAFAMLC